jgi:hypothetical protein
MLRWVYKSGTFLQFAIFAIILVLTWLPAFLHPVLPAITQSDGPLYSLLVIYIGQFPILCISVALILVVIQALVLFYVFQANGFFKRSNFLPAIIILLAYSWNNNYQTLHAVLPAGIFIIIALNSIMKMYGRQAAYHQVFAAAFSIGIASLFYIPLAYLLVMIWLTLITYRISSWREYAVSIIGFILPVIYYVSWLFWNDEVPTGLNRASDSLFNLTWPAPLPVAATLWLSVSTFVMIVTMVAVLNIMNDKLISLRRRSWVLFNFSLTVVLMMFLVGWPILEANYLFLMPMSFFITGSLTLIKRRFWFEMLALGYFLLFIIMRGFLLFG